MTTQHNNKLSNAIKATEEWIEKCKLKGNIEQFTEYGLTIYGCEVRNLAEYKEIEKIQDKRKLTGRLRELYLAI